MEKLIYENIINFLSININENIYCELLIPIENINVLIKIKKRNKQ